MRSKAANILVIDDDPAIRRTMLAILIQRGHKVTLAKDGKEGLSLFHSARFDLVFTDLGIPCVSGWEVVAAIRQHAVSVPVVVMTGWPESIIGQALDPDQVQGILSKPFTIGGVVELVSELIEQPWLIAGADGSATRSRGEHRRARPASGERLAQRWSA